MRKATCYFPRFVHPTLPQRGYGTERQCKVKAALRDMLGRSSRT